MAYAIILLAAILYTWVLVRDTRKQRLFDWNNPIVRTVVLETDRTAYHGGLFGNAFGTVTMDGTAWYGAIKPEELVTFLIVRRNGDQERETIRKKDFRYKEYMKYVDESKQK